MLLCKVWQEKEQDGTVHNYINDLLKTLRQHAAPREGLAAVDAQFTAVRANRRADFSLPSRAKRVQFRTLLVGTRITRFRP